MSKSKAAAKPAAASGSTSAAELGALLSQAGVTKVIMIRHANAAPRDPDAAAAELGVLKPNTPHANAWTVGDLTRGLTDKGREQAAAAKGWLDTHAVKFVIASEAIRATATRDIMCAGREPFGQLTLHTLHPARSGTPECEKMFDTLGYGTLNTYYSNTTVEGCEGRGKAIFRNYMDKVTGELHTLIDEGKATFPPGGNTVAVFGHAVFLNAVSVAIGEAMAIPSAEELVAGMELGETQGIMCDAGAKSITLCSA